MNPATPTSSSPTDPEAAEQHGRSAARRPATNPFPNFTADLDIPFRQTASTLTQLVPFGGPVRAAAELRLRHPQRHRSVLPDRSRSGRPPHQRAQAPKVTLFNGQQAFVADATQRPFVISVIPVVGDFAAAQQPVIVVLNEGTLMTVQAVVSDDRRFVRLTVVPFFRQIGDVDEFTFEGSSSTTSSSSTTDDDDDGKNESKKDKRRRDTQRRHRAVADVLVRLRGHHRQRARRRHRAAWAASSG